MTFLLLKSIAAFIILAVTIVAGVYPFKQKIKKMHLDFPQGESLACGVFLGAALLHMLSDAAVDFQIKGIHYPIAYFLAGTLFLLFLWLEHYGRELYAHKANQSAYLVWLWMLMLSVHSFLAGSALGLSDKDSLSVILFIAIIAHKWAEAFAFAVIINKEHISSKLALSLFVVFSLMTPLGIFLGSGLELVISSNSLLLPIFSSLAAGTFLYLGTLHGLDKGVLVKQCCNLKNYSYVILGFVIMALVAVYN